MNARNKLKTCDLLGIDTHIVYHAHRINKEWGWGLSKKQTVVGVVRVVAIRFNFKVYIYRLYFRETPPPPLQVNLMATTLTSEK